MASDTIVIILRQAVNFFSFDMYRKALQKALGPDLHNEAKLAAGALAGALPEPLTC